MELIRLAAHAVSFLSDISLRGLLIFVVAGLACWTLRRASSASRHLLWSVTLLSLLLLPALCAWLPRWNAPVLPPAAREQGIQGVEQPPVVPNEEPFLMPPSSLKIGSVGSTDAVTSSPTSQAVTDSVPTASPPAVPPNHAPTSPAPAKPTAAEWIAALWLIGFFAVLGRTLLGLLVAANLLRRSHLVSVGPLREALDEAGGRLSLSTPMSLRVGTDAALIAIPMAFGVLRPVILLPQGADGWPAERLQAALRHEAAHVKRLDWITMMFAQVVCALYWFHPLVWLAAHRLRVESEQACDDLVLTSGIQSVDYADHLLEVVRGLRQHRASMSAVVTMACKRDLTGRLKMLLAESKNRSAVTRRGLVLATLAALVIVLPLAAMQPIKRPLTDAVPADAHWKVALPDGTQARLFSVEAGNWGTGQGLTWTPDGKPLNGIPPAIADKDDQAKLRSGGRTFTAVFSFPSKQARHEAHVTLHVLGDHFYALGGKWPLGDRDAQVTASPSHDFPPAQKRADLILTLATGSYTTLVTGTFQGGGSHKLPTGEVVTLSRAMPGTSTSGGKDIKIKGVILTVPAKFVSPAYEGGLEALGPDGQPLPILRCSSNIPNPNHKMEHVFFNYRASDLPEGGVSGFRFHYRLVHTFIFRNVALLPAMPSTPNSVAALPPMVTHDAAFTSPTASARGAGRRVQVTQGVVLELVAASDKPWDNHRWWRPDGTPFVYNPQVFRTNYDGLRTLSMPCSELLFRLTQPERGTTVEGWQSVPEVTPTMTGFSCVDIANGQILSGNLRKISEGPNTFGVRLRVGAGPWRQVQVRSNPGEGITTIKHSGSGWNGAYEVRWLSATATKIVVTPAAQNEAEAMRVVAFDRQGKQYLPGPSFTARLLPGNPPGPRTEYPLSLPLSQIKELVVETRPYRYIDFKGIARQPNAPARLE